MHFKYSAFLNIAFVTMMFGFGMPWLFPLAALGYGLLYVIENALLHYSYSKPPMYDEKLDKSVLSFMKIAPILYFAFGYWMVSSKQLLANNVYPIKNINDTPKTGHLYSTPFTKEGWMPPAWPFLIMFLVVIVYRIVEKTILKLFRVKLEDKEESYNYYESLNKDDREFSIKEEEYGRDKLLGLRIMSDEGYNKIRNSKLKGKAI